MVRRGRPSDGIRRRHLQTAVLKRRITQPKAERKLRLDILGVVVAVADVDSLGVVDLEILARDSSRLPASP